MYTSQKEIFWESRDWYQTNVDMTGFCLSRAGDVNIFTSYVNMNKLHVDINKLHIDINKLHK
jgi:hypothetical protein